MLSNEKTLLLLGTLATASVTGIGLAVGGVIGATVMAGIGINLSSSIIQNGANNLKERWLNEGILNHDIQKILIRAFIRALSALESKYLESEQAKILKGYERASIRELFRELRAKAETNLSESLERTSLHEDVQHYLIGVPNTDMSEVWDALGIDELLSRYGSDFRNFFRQNLLSEILVWFSEELKTDSKETNKAWRAFQRMLLDGIYADVMDIKAAQGEISRDLQKLDVINRQLSEVKDVIDRRLPDELFQQDLEDAIGDIRSTLHSINHTTQRIDRTVDVIDLNVRTLLTKQKERLSPEAHKEKLSQLRTKMIAANSEWELRETLYEVEELLSDYPSAEARLLKHRLETALSRETARMQSASVVEALCDLEEVSSSSRMSLGCLALSIIIIVLCLLYWWFF